jgi:putative nucleotidyltransferase with HDIG domain
MKNDYVQRFVLSDKLREESLKTIISLGITLRKGEPVSITQVEILAHNIIDEIVRRGARGVIIPIEIIDITHYSIAHAVNVAVYSIFFALKLGFKDQELIDIGLGSILHDIGKMNTPDHLVWKQESELSEERNIITSHPDFGLTILRSARMLSSSVKKIISDHHENFDGSGYPKGISSDDIHDMVKIVSICNYYDFLVTSTPMKKGVHPREAMLRIARLGGRQFDPKIVTAFVTRMIPYLLGEPLFPIAALVQLNTGEIATVIGINADIDTRPEVLILTNPQREKLARPLRVNLRKDEGRHISRIIKVKTSLVR